MVSEKASYERAWAAVLRGNANKTYANLLNRTNGAVPITCPKKRNHRRMRKYNPTGTNLGYTKRPSQSLACALRQCAGPKSRPIRRLLSALIATLSRYPRPWNKRQPPTWTIHPLSGGDSNVTWNRLNFSHSKFTQ